MLCSPLGEAVLAPASPAPAPTPSATATAILTPTPTATADLTPTEPPHFATGFDPDRVLEETARMELSASPDWWVNSGAWFLQRDGVGSTWTGEAPADSPWRSAYRRANPLDTDQGAHPQNLFRLITRSEWLAPVQQVYFRVAADHFSGSPNRNPSNGVLLFLRYSDGDHLYYAGVRVDGFAVIKKKSGGIYTTLAEAPLYPGTYHRNGNPNLIPHGAWIGLRAVMQTEGGGVTILLYTDPDRSGFWALAVQAYDAPGPEDALAHAGHGGIRTDFMDVEFDDYRIEESNCE